MARDRDRYLPVLVTRGARVRRFLDPVSDFRASTKRLLYAKDWTVTLCRLPAVPSAPGNCADEQTEAY